MMKRLFWKHRQAHYFSDDSVSTPGVVKKGDYLLGSFQLALKRLGETKFWICPVFMKAKDVVEIEPGVYEAKKEASGLFSFGPMSHWAKFADRFS